MFDINQNNLNPAVWGVHYWFFIHTLALIYPKYPNETTKKKYYDFFQNLPLFIPNDEICKYVSWLLVANPITPYLSDRDSLVKWTFHLHNQVNQKLEKDQITLSQFYKTYMDQYNVTPTYHKHFNKIIYFMILATCLFIIYYFNKNHI